MAPPATELDDSPPPNPEAQESNNLQPFFILHKASPRKPERKLKKAKRRIDLSPSKPQNYDEGDDDRDVSRLLDLRMEAFNLVWSKIEVTIKDVLRNLNANVFNEIHQWVQESFDEIKSHGCPSISRATRSYPVVTTDPGHRQLFTILVLTKNMEFVDDLLTFEELGIHLGVNGCHVANLSSLDFSAKSGLGGCVRTLLREFLKVPVDTADISALASWYSEPENGDKPVVVMIDDMARCCGAVLSDFILMLSEWMVKIPVILVMGSATVDCARKILPTNTLQRLRPRVFVLGSPTQRMDAVVKSILVKPLSGFRIGYRVALFLKNYFSVQDGTLASFVRALKIACVHHFTTEPLSFILGWLNSNKRNQCIWSEYQGVILKAISTYAGDAASCESKNGMPEENSKDLDNRLLELERLQKCWGTAILCLYEAGKYCQIQFLDLLCEALDPDSYNTSLSQFNVDKVQNGSFIYQAIRKVRDLPQMLLEKLFIRWANLTEDLPEINKEVMELQSSLKLDDCKNLKEKASEILRRHKSQNNLSETRTSRVVNERAATLMETMIRDHMQPIECLRFHEIVCFRNVDILQSSVFNWRSKKDDTS